MATRSLTVRSKLALVFFTACALTFGVGGSFISRSVANTLEEEILTRLEFQSRAYATALDGHLSMLARRAEDFASDGFVRDAGEALLDQASLADADASALQELRTSLRSHLLHNKLPLVEAFSDLQVISDGGELLLAAHNSPPADIMRWLVAESGTDRLLFSGLIGSDAPAGLAQMALAAPLISRNGGRRLGWLVAWVNPSAWIFGALGSPGLGFGSEQEDDGRIHLLDGTGSRLTLQRELFGDGLPAADSEHARSGFGLVFETDFGGTERGLEASSGGGTRLSSFPLSSSGWLLEVESSSDAALSAVAGLQGRVFGIGLLVAAAACVLFLLPMRILTRPLLQLAEAARRVGAGDEPPAVTTDSNDEIGEVGRAFVAMAQSVQERTRLQELTAEDLRKGQGELKAERDRLKAVIGSMGGGLIVLDPDGRSTLR